MSVAVIPARGGSRRIPGKNIRGFAGRPMIAWPITAARDSGCFDRIVVSTDDERIAEIVRSLGAEVPFLRPSELSGDHISTVPVIAHAISALGLGVDGDAAVCCLYATAAFVTADDLREARARLLASNADYVMSVTTYASPIQRALRLDAEARVSMIHPELVETRSQDLEPCYHDAGQFYWGRVTAWLASRPILSGKTIAHPLPRERVQDIDTPEDWTRAEAMFRSLVLPPRHPDTTP